MQLLIDVLEQTERLAELLEGLAKVGVTGTTVVDSIGMGRILLQADADVPHKDVIRDVLARGNPTNKTIFAVIPDEGTVRKAIGVIRSVCGDLEDPGKGVVFTVPVGFAEGVAKADP